ncbi:hypothetical protein SA930_1359 [Staphylococcus aureus 930918-3]|uniref:Uncharacterized protein n=1 Tax=Staphylococcus aureus (strain COL) TaxID=93062 RepID=A0A0H2WXM8_STAAC|nr:hypothetical protein SACOL2420 [Staphylococcus aureus subsp. aureus COL]AGY90623.1 Hypothetical protein SAZ172_2524 [Staphylococcus aureus subsp. aureus Z172]AID41116.1 hypothetical protein SAXN108_2675 [Staphylococcus aureus]EEW45598.1 hypothetical protein SA930_1359 [Staphylococcus aureus 930918-3]EEW47676.1 hypothetical protein SAD30_0704 [Staphylococcus aureus D30]EFM07701.1 hypothetical protein HMPREF0783_0642 [Staphylococcus aureus subsp. aureus ATCC BAA-39]EHM58111.1 hypothetical pr
MNQPHNIKLFYRTLNLIITTDFYKNKVSNHSRYTNNTNETI